MRGVTTIRLVRGGWEVWHSKQMLDNYRGGIFDGSLLVHIHGVGLTILKEFSATNVRLIIKYDT